MSESVTIGGIGKNPAIDKINSINAVDIQNYAANRMYQTTGGKNHCPYINEGSRRQDMRTDFGRIKWEETEDGN